MIKKLKYRIRVMYTLRECYKGVTHLFLISLLLSIMHVFISFIRPIFYQIFVDDVIFRGHLNKIWWVLGGYFSVFILNTIIEYVKLYCTNKISNRCIFRLRLKIWKNILEKPFTEYDNLDFNELRITIESDIQVVDKFSDRQSINYVVDFLSLIFLAFILFIIDYRLASISIVIIPVTFFLDHIVSQKEGVLLEDNRIRQREQSHWLQESIQGWREVKALNLVDEEKKRFKVFVNRYGQFFFKWNLYATTRKLVIPKVKDEFIMQFLMYFIGGLLILQHELTIGLLLVFMQYYSYFSDRVKSLSEADAELITNKIQSERVLHAARKASCSTKVSGKKNICIKSIEMNNIYFSYNLSEGWLLKNINLKLRCGDRIALVGKSGAGKSTVIKLILGMLQPQQGVILYNGINIQDIQQSILHRRIGIVMQDNLLFNGTIMENLILGKPNATEIECIEACKMANIYEFISELPNKFETVIGERGIRLSGGQRQRIVLARVFLADVDVYIFDEATSAIDQYSENLIFDAINSIRGDRIVLVVAHRESSIQLCDRVIYIS